MLISKFAFLQVGLHSKPYYSSLVFQYLFQYFGQILNYSPIFKVLFKFFYLILKNPLCFSKWDLYFNNNLLENFITGMKRRFFENYGKIQKFRQIFPGQLKEDVNLVVYNTYIIFACIVLIHTRGIPMGGNPSSSISYLTLAKREFIYMMNLIKNKKFALAKILSTIRRYVDDLITINTINFQNLIN